MSSSNFKYFLIFILTTLFVAACGESNHSSNDLQFSPINLDNTKYQATDTGNPSIKAILDIFNDDESSSLNTDDLRPSLVNPSTTNRQIGDKKLAECRTITEGDIEGITQVGFNIRIEDQFVFQVLSLTPERGFEDLYVSDIANVLGSLESDELSKLLGSDGEAISVEVNCFASAQISGNGSISDRSDNKGLKISKDSIVLIVSAGTDTIDNTPGLGETPNEIK